MSERNAARRIPPARSARAAECRYVDDTRAGWRRLGGTSGFRYARADGAIVRDPGQLRRIERLGIPPAWRDVWICPSPDGHIQATGRDARGRKQYRYHPRFREVRDAAKFERALAFARVLPRIRRRVDRDLRAGRPRRGTVLATLVRLLEITLIRIGNEEYARTNGSFGLATLRERHVDIRGSAIRFRFRGKSGRTHEVSVQDRRLARVLQRCSDLPGQELFQYLDEEGAPRTVEAADVNAYLREAAGAEFSTKDFRTWAGTVLAAEALRGMPADGAAARERNIARAIREVAARLGNTAAVCRRCYVHPAVLEAYRIGRLEQALTRVRQGRSPLSRAEADVRELLRRSLRRGRR
jgi:DNA topoisomerase I